MCYETRGLTQEIRNKREEGRKNLPLYAPFETAYERERSFQHLGFQFIKEYSFGSSRL